MKFKETLSEEEQTELFNKYQETKNHDIRETLILHNLKLVYWVASKYYKKHKDSIDDLFQSGTIGLMRAIETYKSDRGTFSNYAIYYIRQSITRDINSHSKAIRIPEYKIQEVNEIKTEKNILIKKLGRDPTSKELSISLKKDIKEVNEILNIIDDPISLNKPIGEDEDLTLEDSIADDSPPIDLLIEDKIFLEKFRELSKEKLSELQYNIIVLYCGIGCREHTLKELAAMHGYKSVEGVRSERDKGLRILRRTRYFQEIKKEVEERTSYYKSIDYSQPNVSGGGYKTSPVERIAEQREHIRERLRREYNI